MVESATQRAARLKREEDERILMSQAGREPAGSTIQDNVPRVETPKIDITGRGTTWTEEQVQKDVERQTEQLRKTTAERAAAAAGGGGGGETTGQTVFDEFDDFTTVITKDGKKLLFRDKDEARAFVNREVLKGQQPLGTTTLQQLEFQQQGQRLAGQVGQFGKLGISPTALDFGEAATAGLVGALPSSIRTAGTLGLLAAAGAKGGAVVGAAGGPVGALGGAAIGAGVGLIAGFVSSMTSNMKAQRTDTTTAQQRVLDEGKQTLNDWITLARTYPSKRQEAISNFNIQLSLIDEAHRQMKLDTKEDVLKFETALPNLAEFNSFYSAQGERDFLVAEMRAALQTPVTDEFAFAELSQRLT
ncbi:MAG: hypothetical protein CMI54_04250 [Parcubacteria group bacterium]|nr:hypothetical protein [Parcubacteria group bacterium]|tara:strand:+ start:4308 stop:5387 length:1080 start_codon:yes stop_codon:yes gene_type:complete